MIFLSAQSENTADLHRLSISLESHPDSTILQVSNQPKYKHVVFQSAREICMYQSNMWGEHGRMI